MEYDTIAAVATPTGRAGVGIIKISGPDAFSIADSIFQKYHDSAEESRHADVPPFSLLKSHSLNYGHIFNPENGKILDEVLLSVMKAPRTYTRENVVEINTHSGHVVLLSILELILKKGARLAEPGEFTKRAYLNGRIDLTQAEAVIDIVNSRTEKSLEIAISQIKGGLKNRIEAIRSTLLDILTEGEAAIDFPEDTGGILNDKRVVEILDKDAIEKLKELIDQYDNAHYYRDGLKMVIVGKPNVGKSSLMNRLIKEDRAIVTPIPGTTRDLIEEMLNIQGIPVIIADTAGLHETDDPVEVLGMGKTREYIDGSDLVLFMIDASDPLSDEEYKIYKTIDEKPVILVINKMDLVKDDFELVTPDSWKKIPSVKVSARYGRGLHRLKSLIGELTTGGYRFDVRNTIIPNLRHKIAIERSLQRVVSAKREIKKGTPFELISLDIREAIESLGEIIGVVAGENIIDQIFSRFCIGK